MQENPCSKRVKNKLAAEKSAPSSNSKNLETLLYSQGLDHKDLIQKKGEEFLFEGDSKAMHYFCIANELDKNNFELYYQQGIALFTYGKEHKIKKYLLMANKKFKIATQLKKDFFAAYQAWANSLYLLGKLYQKHHYFLESKDKFHLAFSCSDNIEHSRLSASHWVYGALMKEIAIKSQETGDLHTALKSYETAHKLISEHTDKFYRQYAQVCQLFSEQINDMQFMYKSIELHKKAIYCEQNSSINWLEFAKTLASLYTITFDEEHFFKSNESFANAAKLGPANTHIWKSWAKLLLKSAERLKDTKRLASCIEKCHKAHSCNKKDAQILGIWAEAICLIANYTNRLDFLHEAHNKVVQMQELYENSTEMFFAKGKVLFTKGQYFQDEDYYFQAIEAYQEGLSQNRTLHNFWFEIGKTYLLTAHMQKDPELFERSIYFLNKATNLNPTSQYYSEYAKALSQAAEFESDETKFEYACALFEKAIHMQNNTNYLHPEFLFSYAKTLDGLADLTQNEELYYKALEILKRIVVLDPDFTGIHFQLATVYSHIAESTEDEGVYRSAFAYYKICAQEQSENDQILLDWGLCLLSYSQTDISLSEKNQYLHEAEYKLTNAAKLGNTHAFYQLACLYSLNLDLEKSLFFLNKAQDFNALPCFEEIMQDSWIENLRATPAFQALIAKLQAQKE